MNDMNQFILEAINKATRIAVHASARMCDMDLKCIDHDDGFESWCLKCEGMINASEQIKEKILSLLDASQQAKDSVSAETK